MGRGGLSEVDNHEAQKVGDLEKNSQAIKVVRVHFDTETFLDAAVRERVGQLTLRRGANGFQRSFKEVLSAPSSTPPKWRLAGGHHRWCAKTGTQSAKPSTTASRERLWENLYYKFVGMSKAVSVRHPSGSSRVKTLWKGQRADDRYHSRRNKFERFRGVFGIN